MIQNLFLSTQFADLRLLFVRDFGNRFLEVKVVQIQRHFLSIYIRVNHAKPYQTLWRSKKAPLTLTKAFSSIAVCIS